MLTEIISHFVSVTDYEDLPKTAVEAAKNGILDYWGVALAGSQEPLAKILVALAKESNCHPEATIIGSGLATSCSFAAWVNGTQEHAIDLDNCLHISGMALGHTSATILPAVLAVGEKLNRSGKDVIVAYCLGVEIYAKLAMLGYLPAYEKGWHGTSVVGTMAAAGAAAMVIGLKEPQVRRALGIAASLANGLRANFGTMVKSLHAGNAARNGVEAALLAEKGFSSCETIIEASCGWYSTFAGQGNLPESIVDELAKNLGNPWSIHSPGQSYKLYPSCRGTHPTIEAALQFREKHNWQEILEVECVAPSMLKSITPYHNPHTGLEAKFSLEYCLAAAFIDGQKGMMDFSDRSVNKPQVKALMSKIKVSYVESGTSFPPYEFRLTLKDGTTDRCTVDMFKVKGEDQNPLTKEELIAKYQDCCAISALSPKAADRLKDLILNLERVESVSQLITSQKT